MPLNALDVFKLISNSLNIHEQLKTINTALHTRTLTETYLHLHTSFRTYTINVTSVDMYVCMYASISYVNIINAHSILLRKCVAEYVCKGQKKRALHYESEHKQISKVCNYVGN